MNRKLPLHIDDLPYRPCVGVVVLNKDGFVWAGRRIAEGNTEYDGSPQLWQMPQGGIDKADKQLAAAYRELYEETGHRTGSLLGQSRDRMTYGRPPGLSGSGLKGKYRGQTQRWVAFRLEGEEHEISI